MDKLKPCPFCGGQAEIIPTWDGLYKAECRNCRCSTGAFCKSRLALLRWNKRVRPKSSGWISVRDRLPEELFGESETVLVITRVVDRDFTGYSERYDLACTVNKEWKGCKGIVTHWMPLPEPPPKTKGEIL